MPLVQDAATAITPATETTPATAVIPTEPAAQASAAPASVPATTVDSNVAAPPSPAVAASSEVNPTPKTDVATSPKTDANADAKPEDKAQVKSPGLTITKSETITTPLAPKSPSDSIWLFTLLPVVIMMGLLLYFRGQKQAAERARADALLAASSKKSRKSTRPQSDDNADSASGSPTGMTSERKGNSKKNKKDKQQQKKKQQVNSGATTSKASRVTVSLDAPSSVAKPVKETASVKSISAPATNAPASVAELKSVAPAAQPAKAIFEPLRKITASAPKETEVSEVETDESDEQERTPNRKRRPSPPPPVITTPAKVSSGRFEKLNLPPANAGLSASSVNRWPTEATRPVATVRAPQPTTSPRANSKTSPETGQAASPAPITARGLGAFVKLAKPSAEAESTSADTANVRTESSGT